MNATEVLAELLQLAQDNDHDGLESWNLPPNVARILPRLTTISAQIRQLEPVVQRLETEEAELEQLALQLIQSAGLATTRPTSDQSPDQPAAAAAAADA